ncbi:MAG: DUF805 domain-containing protein [Clostridium sp.]|nr:DUF805 domain-containing protein [Clostridium sp.]MBO6150567.1 DUF805 domain-containing protein [Clostridium sp.]
MFFQNFTKFDGRSRRKEYWYPVLFQLLVNMVIGIFAIVIGFVSQDAGAMLSRVLTGLVSLALLIPSIAVSIRRMHDIGKSGWWLLIVLVPCVGGFIYLYFCCQDSQPGANQYGPNPKYS